MGDDGRMKERWRDFCDDWALNRDSLWSIPAAAAIVLLGGLLVVGSFFGGIAEIRGWFQPVQITSIDRYCNYGTISADQRDSCPDRVSESYINGLDTNAAKYARYEITECREDSGPYCSPRNDDAAKTREYEKLVKEAELTGRDLDLLQIEAETSPDGDVDWSTAVPAEP